MPRKDKKIPRRPPRARGKSSGGGGSLPQSGTAFAVVALGIFAYFYMKGQLVYLKPSDTGKLKEVGLDRAARLVQPAACTRCLAAGR